MQLKQWQARVDALAHNSKFEFVVVMVIIASALLIGAKSFDVPADVMRWLAFADNMVTAFFVLEIALRYAAAPSRADFFKDPWNLFDTVIVAISLIPIAAGDQALVARLIRVFRVLRMVSIIPELRILLNSLIKALPQLGYVILLMFIIFYIYGAVGTTLFAAINPVLWGDIAVSMLTLFRVMTFEDWTDVMYETMAVYPMSWLYYLSFIFFTAFAFLNMVIGIVVNELDRENQKAEAERDQAQNKPSIDMVYAELRALRQSLGHDADEQASRASARSRKKDQ